MKVLRELKIISSKKLHLPSILKTMLSKWHGEAGQRVTEELEGTLCAENYHRSPHFTNGMCCCGRNRRTMSCIASRNVLWMLSKNINSLIVIWLELLLLLLRSSSSATDYRIQRENIMF